jgi:type I restriction-modification system DNA methylase subunit
MSEEQQQELGKTLWAIADSLRGSMNADDFRDYMLSFLFLRYLSEYFPWLNKFNALAYSTSSSTPRMQKEKSLEPKKIAVFSSDLAKLLKGGAHKIKTVISSHHGLFFNVIVNELIKEQHRKYFLHRDKKSDIYTHPIIRFGVIKC